jgi:uncharacterized Zn-binding protein involved in type VI secretion
MPGFVIHQGATVNCPHGGKVVMAPSLRVKVSGQPVALASMYAVVGCAGPTPPGPCATGKWLTFSTRVFADGQPVVLTDSTSLSAASSTPVTIIQSQFRVKGT